MKVEQDKQVKETNRERQERINREVRERMEAEGWDFDGPRGRVLYRGSEGRRGWDD